MPIDATTRLPRRVVLLDGPVSHWRMGPWWQQVGSATGHWADRQARDASFGQGMTLNGTSGEIPLQARATWSPAARHAQVMADALQAGGSRQHERQSPGWHLLNLVIFDQTLSTSTRRLADALEMAIDWRPALVHGSVGLAREDPVLRDRVAQLQADGCMVVVSAPARGGPVYPAAWPGVIGVQGDARCGPGEWSWLDIPGGASFGARVDGAIDPTVAGASLAAARFSGLLMRAWRADESAEECLARLAREARWLGREQRGHRAGSAGDAAQ